MRAPDRSSVVRLESDGCTSVSPSPRPVAHGPVLLGVIFELIPCAIVMLAVTLCVLTLLSKLGA